MNNQKKEERHTRLIRFNTDNGLTVKSLIEALSQVPEDYELALMGQEYDLALAVDDDIKHILIDDELYVEELLADVVYELQVVEENGLVPIALVKPDDDPEDYMQSAKANEEV